MSSEKPPLTRPSALIILDGFGSIDDKKGNAIAYASMPTWHKLATTYPATTLAAAGAAVGLPDGMSGNSEVGHLTIGAGEVVLSVQQQVDARTAAGTFGREQALQDLLSVLAAKNKPLHLLGLLSSGGIHSDHTTTHHFVATAQKAGVRTYLHAILDGRDVEQRSATTFLTAYEECGGKIASIQGRFYGMDRDENWDRIAESYEMMTGETAAVVSDWRDVLADCYQRSLADDHIPPTLLQSGGVISDGDGMLFFNVRADRARQLTRAFMQPSFDGFACRQIALSGFLTLGHFDDAFNAWGVQSLVQPALPRTTLLEELVQQHPNRKIACLAESEKRAHVTYFFDGRVERERPNVTTHIVPSPAVAHFDQQPAMAAAAITQRTIELLAGNQADTFIINYANADMVGHTGNFKATIAACEVLDAQLAVLYEHIVVQRGGTLIITADHGNAEQMLTDDGQPCTTHTANRVPLVVAGVQVPDDMLDDATELKDVMGAMLRVLRSDAI